MISNARIIEVHVPPEGVISQEDSLTRLISFLQSVGIDCAAGAPGQSEVIYGDHDEHESQFIVDMVQLFNMRLVDNASG